MAERLRLKRIEQRPKSVFFSQNFRTIDALTPQKRAIFRSIIADIEAGRGVSAENYRTGIDRDVDHVLGRYGIMHLHLGAGSSELVFLAQYEDCAIILEVSDHRHFTPPPGKLLNERHPRIDRIADHHRRKR